MCIKCTMIDGSIFHIPQYHTNSSDNNDKDHRGALHRAVRGEAQTPVRAARVPSRRHGAPPVLCQLFWSFAFDSKPQNLNVIPVLRESADANPEIVCAAAA